jgi:hypothetical protein
MARNERIAADYSSGLTLEQLRDKYQLSLSQLSRITNEHGVKRNRRHICNDDAWIKLRLDAGNTIRMMSDEAGVSIGTMAYWVRRYQGVAKSKPQSTLGVCCVQEHWDNAEWFTEQYKTCGIPSIARMLGRSVGFVSSRLKLYRIPRNTLSEAMQKFRKRPSRDWLIQHYQNLGWSIQKCADEFGVSFNVMLQALRDNKVDTRSASEQHQGDLNEFFGQHHTEETKELCAEIGSRCGKEYWATGDIDAKRELQSIISTQQWSDQDKRRLSSERIAKLCQEGKCTPATRPYASNGDLILLKSSWEEAIARFLDSCPVVEDWKYEHVVIPYMIDDDVHNFVVDFWVLWSDGLQTLIESKNEHLLGQEKEKLKMSALADYCKVHRNGLVTITTKEEVKKLLSGWCDLISWTGNRYNVARNYLEYSRLQHESIVHEIIKRVCPWDGVTYTTNELANDLLRLKNEKLSGYIGENLLRSTASNSGGMPGKQIIVNFQPHFWDVAPKNRKPLPESFDDKLLIYKNIWQSIGERESLSFERLLREINFHNSSYGRTSHFAPGFARSIIKLMNASGKRIFDPCCGWGGRLIGAFLEGCDYSGCELSPQSCDGLVKIAEFIGINADIQNKSCLDLEWPESDLIFTSPPFYDIEQYIGGQQPWFVYRSRAEWVEKFIAPFADKSKYPTVLYLDKKTLDDFSSIRPFSRIVEVSNRRHARRQKELEYLGIWD